MRSVRVQDYMATRLVTLSPQTSAVEAMRTLLDRRISGAPVVDGEGQLVGVLSEVDLMQVVVQDSYYDENSGVVGDFMKTAIETVDANEDIYSLAERFMREGRRRYPVLKDGRLVGQISRRDVLRAFEDFLQRR